MSVNKTVHLIIKIKSKIKVYEEKLEIFYEEVEEDEKSIIMYKSKIQALRWVLEMIE